MLRQREQVKRKRPWTRWVATSLGVIGLLALGYWLLTSARQISDPDQLAEKIWTDLKEERIDQAQKSLARLDQLRPPTSSDHLLKAEVAIASNRDDEAIRALERIDESERDRSLMWMRAGQFALRRARTRVAERALLRSAEIDPKQVQAYRELIYLYGMKSQFTQMRRQFVALARLADLKFDQIFLWCLSHRLAWEPDEITGLLRNWVEADPEDTKGRLALAENLRQCAKLDEADQILDTLPENLTEARALRARIALERGEITRAEALLVEGSPDDPVLARMRGQIALQRKDGKAATEYFQIALKQAPDDRNVLFDLGQSLRLSGRAGEADPYLKRARLHDNLATALEKSVSHANRNDPKTWRELGEACEALGRIPEARAWYRLILTHDAFDTEAQKALFRLKSQVSSTEAATNKL